MMTLRRTGIRTLDSGIKRVLFVCARNLSACWCIWKAL